MGAVVFLGSHVRIELKKNPSEMPLKRDMYKEVCGSRAPRDPKVPAPGVDTLCDPSAGNCAGTGDRGMFALMMGLHRVTR